MSNIQSVGCWWKFKVIIWSTPKEEKKLKNLKPHLLSICAERTSLCCVILHLFKKTKPSLQIPGVYNFMEILFFHDGQRFWLEKNYTCGGKACLLKLKPTWGFPVFDFMIYGTGFWEETHELNTCWIQRRCVFWFDEGCEKSYISRRI